MCWKYSRERTFSVLKPPSKQVNLFHFITVSFYRERFRNNFFCMLVVSSLTPPQTLALLHSVQLVPHSHHPPHVTLTCSHSCCQSWEWEWMPLHEFSDPLDVSVCIFPALSTPCCTQSASSYCCLSPRPPPALACKHSATQSHEHCPLPFPGIYFCAHKIAIPGDLLFYLPLQWSQANWRGYDKY